MSPIAQSEQPPREQYQSQPLSLRQRTIVESPDFANWYLRKRSEWPPPGQVSDSKRRSLIGGSCHSLHLRPGHGADDLLRQLAATTTKRARRNSTGWIADRGEPGGDEGMNLQSTGQTAAVGKGYHQSTALQQNSLSSGECPWYLQNPGAALNNNNNPAPPPTAPLRQHKRPAPQPGVAQFPVHLPQVHAKQQPTHNLQTQHHLLGGPTLPSDGVVLKPNSIAILPQHSQTYQSTNTQPSPKSPSTALCGGANSVVGGHNHHLMSTSLNSAHLSNHGECRLIKNWLLAMLS